MASLGHSENEYNNPVHEVRLSGYSIGETEVTQELYEAVMGSNPSKNQASKLPVEQVSWYDAVAFCNKLTEKVYSSSDCVYTIENIVRQDENDPNSSIKGANVTADWGKKGFRLPTEAEWEWAAKGGSTVNRYAGTDDVNKLAEYAWCHEVPDFDGKTHEVKTKKPNGYGLYDMSGNVWEWCWDWNAELQLPLSDDYTGPKSGSTRVWRGGGIIDDMFGCMISFRSGGNPADAMNYTGFRIACRP